MARNTKIILIIFFFSLIVFLVVFIFEKNNNEITEDNEIRLISEIKIPLIEPGAIITNNDAVEDQGDYIGCGDKIVYVSKKIEKTTRPLEAIYKEIFKGDEITQGTNYQNPITDHIDSLNFDKVNIENDIAKVYLTGEYITIGTCEPPRTQAVLVFAAKQYPWIKDVEIYLNGQEMIFIHGGM